MHPVRPSRCFVNESRRGAVRHIRGFAANYFEPRLVSRRMGIYNGRAWTLMKILWPAAHAHFLRKLPCEISWGSPCRMRENRSSYVATSTHKYILKWNAQELSLEYRCCIFLIVTIIVLTNVQLIVQLIIVNAVIAVNAALLGWQ